MKNSKSIEEVFGREVDTFMENLVHADLSGELQGSGWLVLAAKAGLTPMDLRASLRNLEGEDRAEALEALEAYDAEMRERVSNLVESLAEDLGLDAGEINSWLETDPVVSSSEEWERRIARYTARFLNKQVARNQQYENDTAYIPREGLDLLLEDDPAVRAQGWLLIGLGYRQSLAPVSKVQAAFSRGMKEDPTNEALYIGLAQCALAIGDRAETRRWIEMGIAKLGATPDLRVELGVCFHADSDYLKATTIWEAVLAEQPDHEGAIAHLEEERARRQQR